MSFERLASDIKKDIDNATNTVAGWAKDLYGSEKKQAQNDTKTAQENLKKEVSTPKESTPEKKEVPKSTKNLDSVKRDINDIAQIFNNEIFAGPKAQLAVAEKKAIDKTISEINGIVSAIPDDAALASNEEIKKRYKEVRLLFNEKRSGVQMLCGKDAESICARIDTKFNSLESSIYAKVEKASSEEMVTTSSQTPSVTFDKTSENSTSSMNSEQKLTSFLVNNLGMDAGSWITKAIVWFAGMLGITKIFDWIGDIVDTPNNLMAQAKNFFMKPIDLAKNAIDKITPNWIKSLLGGKVDLGTIAEAGKTYANEKLGITGNNQLFSMNGKSFSVFLGDTKQTITYKKGDDSHGDYVVINGQEFPIPFIKNRIEAENGENSVVVASNFGNGKQDLVFKA